jgi:hypothetical protein
MCDFRKPPRKVKLLGTGEVKDVPYRGNKPGDGRVPEQGMYCVPGTGTFYAYFDGDGWWRCRDDWGPVNPETGYVHESFKKYEFQFEQDESGCRHGMTLVEPFGLLAMDPAYFTEQERREILLNGWGADANG